MDSANVPRVEPRYWRLLLLILGRGVGAWGGVGGRVATVCLRAKSTILPILTLCFWTM